MTPEEIKPAILFNSVANTFYWVTDSGHTPDVKWPHGTYYSEAEIPEVCQRFYALPPNTEELVKGLERKVAANLARERYTRDTLKTVLKGLENKPPNAQEVPATDNEEDEDSKPKRSSTYGMNLAQRILHVGGRNNAAGYVEFGSLQAVEALIAQLLRDEEKPGANPEPNNGKEHRWNSEGERCVKCRDKDWMGGPCSVSDAEFIYSSHKRIKELEEACVESAQSDIPLKDELEATHRKLEDANAEIENLNAKLTSLQSNYDASIQLGKSLEQQRNELRSEITLNLMQTKDLVAYVIEGVVDGFEGKKLMIQWVSGGKEKLKIGDGLYVLGSVNSTKLCDTCRTPNSCGGDGRCLEEYIKARITSGILPKTDTDIINKGCRYETRLND
jgi:hypothetical protein